jgi:hypothetical protein
LDIPVQIPFGTKRGLSQLYKALQQAWTALALVVNQNISFGNPTSGADNISGAWVSFAVAAANVDQVLTHNLGRIPYGYICMSKSEACDVYTGSAPATQTQITLRGTTTGAVVELFII